MAIQRYNRISEILPFVANTAVRAELIKKVAEEHGISSQTVRNYLCTYLATMDISSLAPKKRKVERALTEDEKNIRKALNKWYYATKKRTLKNVYIMMLQNYYCDAEGKLVEKYPSYYQFRYFFRKYNKKSTEYISRNGLSCYQRNQRPLIGNGVQAFAPTVGLGMLDSTVCHIYLISDAGELVGRPILTLCVDAFSGVICGYSLSWEGGMYSLRDLLLNVIEDKVEYCKRFGIELTEEQRPCNQLPMKFVTDQGSEYKGCNLEQITDLGVELINLQSYRADNKGPVEQCFNALQNYFKPILKGRGVIERTLAGTHIAFEEICMVAMFLGIPAEELARLETPLVSQEQEFDQKVMKLLDSGMSVTEVAKELGVAATIVRLARSISTKERVMQKRGYKSYNAIDWEKMDSETIRNKLCIGHKRNEIFLSNFISCALATIALTAVWLLTSALLFGMIGTLEMEVSKFIGCIFVAIGFAVSFAALYTVIGSLSSNKAMTIIYTFAVFIVFVMAASALYDRLCEPEMNEGMEIIGTQLVAMEPTPNPLYLSGTIRIVCEVALELLPTGQALLLSDVAIEYPVRAIVLSVVFTTVTLLLGSMLFRRKDIK